jgi:hypothetical protein
MVTFSQYINRVHAHLNFQPQDSIEEAHTRVLRRVRPDLHGAMPNHANPQHEGLERFLRWVLDNWY